MLSGLSLPSMFLLTTKCLVIVEFAKIVILSLATVVGAVFLTLVLWVRVWAVFLAFVLWVRVWAVVTKLEIVRGWCI